MTTPESIGTPDAEGWRPESGDVLVGTVEELDIGFSDFRGNYPILTIRPDAEKCQGKCASMDAVKVHCFHDVLYSRVMTLRPEAGETVGIQFHGKHPHKSKPGQTVSRYTFKVAGRTADAAGVYDRMGPPPTRQTQPAQSALPVSDVPADTRDFTPAAVNDDDDIPF